MDSANNTITVCGREFSVTQDVTSFGEKRYILTGKRGAVYATMRNRNRPEMMFLFSGKGRGLCSLGEVWLTDKNGALEVVS